MGNEPYALWKRYWLCWASALLLEGCNVYTLSLWAPEITCSYDGCSQGKGCKMLRYKNTNAHSLHTAKQCCMDVLCWRKRVTRGLGELIAYLHARALPVTGYQNTSPAFVPPGFPFHTHLHFQEFPKLVLPVSCSWSSGWL